MRALRPSRRDRNDPGIGRNRIRLAWWRSGSTHWTTTRGPAVSSCGQKTSAWVCGSRRRVSGLRREELALLAGISAEYYLRLEQGRDKNPSAQVLDALARALRLDIKATEYLHQIASPSPARQDYAAVEVVPDGTQELIDQFAMPAIVAGRCLDVLVADAAAQVLSPGFPQARTSCAGGCWSRPRARCTSSGTRRPTSRSAGCVKRLEAIPTTRAYSR